MGRGSLLEQVDWRDPRTGQRLVPRVTARTPSGSPLCGALQVEGTATGYPIVDSVLRLTPESAALHSEWLTPLGLVPPSVSEGQFQSGASVASFGFQWAWNSAMRNEADLRWRTAERFRLDPAVFRGRLVLDAGAGAGDQSRWLLDQGAAVVSVDLSSAIDVVAQKLRMREGWIGVQGDITALPFAGGQFDHVYCEGVIQHTRDSAETVAELCRVTRPGGVVLATHYGESIRRMGRLKLGLVKALRRRLSRLDRYRLLWVTGNIAALAYVPVLGAVVRRLGIARHYAGMPDFKTTWTNTFDEYGNHTYQRYVTPAQFAAYFEAAGDMTIDYREHTLVVARKGGIAGDA